MRYYVYSPATKKLSCNLNIDNREEPRAFLERTISYHKDDKLRWLLKEEIPSWVINQCLIWVSGDYANCLFIIGGTNLRKIEFYDSCDELMEI